MKTTLQNFTKISSKSLHEALFFHSFTKTLQFLSFQTLSSSELTMALRRSPALAEGRSPPLEPPFFDGTLYHLWKFQMEVFLKSLDLDLWDIVENGYTPPSKPRPEWTNQDQRAWSLNARAMNALCCGLASREIGRVYTCTTATEMWRSLEVFHEGTSQVKKAKIDFLVRRYELFKMRPDESVSEMVARLDEIVSSLK